jgi:hypothetical protein
MPISTISQAGLDAPISLTSPTLTTPNINSAQVATVSGTAPLYMCRAWVNFNGTGTVAIRASGNVSSITDDATGSYTVNFTTAMPDTNYTTQISGRPPSDFVAFSYIRPTAVNSGVYSTSAVGIRTASHVGPASADLDIISVAIFR